MDSTIEDLRPPVFLSWTDVETGEELCILVHGPAQFLEELREEGFRTGDPDCPEAGRAARVVVGSGS